MRRRRVLPYSLLALAATAAAGGYAAHRLLDRPGETAIAWAPANAVGVVSIDLVPAPDQVLAFKSIDDMIAKSGKASKGPLIGSLLPAAMDEPALKPLIEQIDRSLAVVALPKRDPKAEGEEAVGLLPVNDPAAVAAYLKKGKPETVEGVAMVMFKQKNGEGMHLVLEGSTVIASDQGWAVAEVAKVARGQAKALVADPAFAAARAKALPSANLVVVVSPKVSKGKDWTVASMTIRDTGMEVAVSGQTDDPDVIKAGGLAPLGSGVLAALPRGAYGFMATAQPGPAVALAGESLDEPAKEMKKEMDLDLKADVLPALGGNLVLGFYPSFGPDAGLDLLVSMDDANGADPAVLARKLQKIVSDKMEEEEPGAKDKWIDPLPTPGMEGGRLGAEPAQEMEKGIKGMEKSFFRPLTLSRGKTVAWTTVGRSVVFATSQALLDRAVAARKAPSAEFGLSGDPALGAHPEVAADGQFALAISMRRLAEGLRNTIDPSHMSADTAKIYRKGLGLFDNVTEPLAIRANMEADGHYHGYLSIPFDWAKLPEMGK